MHRLAHLLGALPSLLVCFVAGAQQAPVATTPQGAPKVMHLCTDKCQTLTWVGDHYDGVQDGEKTTFGTYRIEQWGPSGVRFHGASLLEYKGNSTPIGQFKISKHGHVEGDFTAMLAPDGASVNEGIVKFRSPWGNGERAFTLTWQAKPDELEAACPAPDPALLQPINLVMCGGGCIRKQDGDLSAWTFSGTNGRGTWKKGGRGNLTIQKWTKDEVVVFDDNPPDSTTPGLRALFTGKVCGNSIRGTFSVTWPGHFDNLSGLPWTATAAPVNCDHVGDDNLELKETARQLLFFRNPVGAFGCFTRAAALGDTDARVASALMMRDGLGTKVDFETARRTLESAAASRDYNAELALSDIYDLGLGVPRDGGQADFWRKRAWTNPAAVAERQARQDQKDMQQMMFTGLCAMVEAFSRPSVYVSTW